MPNYNNRLINEILDEYAVALGNDKERYQNHVYRVYELCRVLDSGEELMDKYAIAAAFHDLGIWTEKTFDYLEPSISLANQYLDSIGKPNWKKELGIMIDMHHKKSPYKGFYRTTVETFRRADWIDVSMGWMKFGLSNHGIRHIQKSYPSKGFHLFLVKQTFKQFLKTPRNPLPMFKS